MSRVTIELEADDLKQVVYALRRRAVALHTLADECLNKAPEDSTWRQYRNRGNDLKRLADRIEGPAEQHDTDVSELISRPEVGCGS